jgi:KDO2-lipid IV(A) lauroyltransferase
MYHFYRFIAKAPLSFLYFLSDILFQLVYRIARYRRKVVDENLCYAFPEKSAEQLDVIARNFYKHLCDLLLEMLASGFLSLDQLRRRVELQNVELIKNLVAQGQSPLLLTAHQGNWEWLLHVLHEEVGCPIDVVYKPLHNEGVDRVMYEARSRSGTPIPFKDAGRHILRRGSRPHCYAMLADQSPFKRDPRYWHNFLGRPASFYLGPQRLAERANFPVVYVAMEKIRRGHYRAKFEMLDMPPHEKGGHEILDNYIDALETSIRTQPDTWLWSNRKWKHKPADTTDAVHL